MKRHIAGLVFITSTAVSAASSVGAMETNARDSARKPDADESAILSAYLSNLIATQPDIPKDRIICINERYIEEPPDWNLSLVRRLDKGEGERGAFESLRKKPKPRAISEALVSVAGLKLREVPQEAVPGPECSTRPRHTISRPIMYKNRAFVVSYVGRAPCAAYAIVSRIDKIGASWKVVATKGLHAALPPIGCGQLWTPAELNNIKGRYYLIGD